MGDSDELDTECDWLKEWFTTQETQVMNELEQLEDQWSLVVPKSRPLRSHTSGRYTRGILDAWSPAQFDLGVTLPTMTKNDREAILSQAPSRLSRSFSGSTSSSSSGSKSTMSRFESQTAEQSASRLGLKSKTLSETELGQRLTGHKCISQDITECIKRKSLGKEPTSLFTVRVDCYWELLRCVEAQLDGDKAKILDAVLLTADDGLNAVAMPCREFLERTWPDTCSPVKQFLSELFSEDTIDTSEDFRGLRVIEVSTHYRVDSAQQSKGHHGRRKYGELTISRKSNTLRRRYVALPLEGRNGS